MVVGVTDPCCICHDRQMTRGSVILELTEEQAFFGATTRKFLESEVPLSKVRELYESAEGFEREWWRQTALLGWTSFFVPESLGGGSESGRPT